jgi:hypothetical protein
MESQMGGYDGNTVRKEKREMARPVQQAGANPPKEISELDDDLILIDIRTRAAMARDAKHASAAVESTMDHTLPDKRIPAPRIIAPLSLLAFFGIYFILSSFLPIGIREYISALIR